VLGAALAAAPEVDSADSGLPLMSWLIEDILLKHPFPLVNTTYTSLEIL